MNKDDLIFWLLAAGLFAIAMAGVLTLSSSTCAAQADAMGLEYSWGPLQGCIVQTDAGAVPVEAVRVVK